MLLYFLEKTKNVKINYFFKLKDCAWFIENEIQFQMLKKVPAAWKKNMALMFISQGTYPKKKKVYFTRNIVAFKIIFQF